MFIRSDDLDAIGMQTPLVPIFTVALFRPRRIKLCAMLASQCVSRVAKQQVLPSLYVN